MFSGAPGIFFPLFEETAVAEGHDIGGGNVQAWDYGVDPVVRTFELGEEADWCFVDHAMTPAVGKLRPPFLIDKDGSEAEHGEDAGDGFAVFDLRLGLQAMLVQLLIVAVIRGALVGDDPLVPILADPQDLVLRAQTPVCGIVKRVAFKRAGRDKLKVACL